MQKLLAKSAAAEIAPAILGLQMAIKSLKSARACEVESEAAMVDRALAECHALIIPRSSKKFMVRAELLNEASGALSRRA